MTLTGNTIFITGGGSGIGRGLAEALHKLGNQILISGRRKSHLDATTKTNPGIASLELEPADNRESQPFDHWDALAAQRPARGAQGRSCRGSDCATVASMARGSGVTNLLLLPLVRVRG
jgi:NAD(P)-dependent dehydrogenase (short-subunit alcohol dehydrogenase family)